MGNPEPAGERHVGNSARRLLWGNDRFQFDNTAAATAADHAAWAAMGNGAVHRSRFENLVNASTDYLIHANRLSPPPVVPTACFAPDLRPIGAFYESRAAATDHARSIAGKTLRIVNSAGAAVTAAQLTARDVDQDGQLRDAELDGLSAWRDWNEDGVLNQAANADRADNAAGSVNELTALQAALADAGLSSVRASDYHFTLPATRTPAAWPTPLQSCRSLRAIRSPPLQHRSAIMQACAAPAITARSAWAPSSISMSASTVTWCPGNPLR